MQQLNEDSNSLSIGFGLAPLEMRPQLSKVQKSKNLKLTEQRIQLLDHRLIQTILLITPDQVQSYQFRNQLKNYRFQRKTKSSNLHSQLTITEQRQIQQLYAAFKDAFSIWRGKLQHKVFITFSNGDLFYFFHKLEEQDLKTNKKKGGSFAILSCRKSNYSAIFTQSKIPYEDLKKTDLENERLLLRNNAVQIFWKYLMNSSISSLFGFEIVANFHFLNSCEILPIENYNGIERRPEYDYIVNQKQNFLGQVQKTLFSMKIEGLWLKQNVQKMYERLQKIFQGKSFEMQFVCHHGSEDFKQQIEPL